MKRNAQEMLNASKAGSEKYFDRQMELLKRFAAIDCGTGSIAGNGKAVEIVRSVLEEFGVGCELIETPGMGTHVIGRIKSERATGKIIINSHLDTVFEEGDTAKHPFRIDGDWAYGLGVADCKGGFVTSASAVKIMKDAGLLPDKDIVMIYNCDEETGSRAGREIFRREARDAECAFVFEPARNKNGIITKRKGQALCSLTVTGKEAHAALNPDGGCSATLELAHKILLLERMKKPGDGIHYVVGRLNGSRTSLAVAAHAWAEAAVSLESAASAELVRADMSAAEADVQVQGCITTAEVDVVFPPMERTEGNARLYAVAKKAGELMGLELPEEASAGPSDACFFSSYGVPTIDALGPFMKDIHTVDEAMYIPGLPERTRLFCLILGYLGEES